MADGFSIRRLLPLRSGAQGVMAELSGLLLADVSFFVA